MSFENVGGHSEIIIIFLYRKVYHCLTQFFDGLGSLLVTLLGSENRRHSEMYIIPSYRKCGEAFRKDGHNHSETMALNCDKSLMELFLADCLMFNEGYILNLYH